MANHNEYDGWELTGRQLGKGGQGTVHLARSPEWAEQRRDAAGEVEEYLWPHKRQNAAYAEWRRSTNTI